MLQHASIIDIGVAVISAIIGGLLLAPIGRLLRAAVLFVPHRIGDEFKGIAKFAPILERSKSDAHAAVVYLGAQLAKMMLSCWFSLILVGCIFLVAIVSSGWLSTYRVAILVFLVMWLVGSVYHLLKRLLTILLLYTAVFEPATKAPTPTKQPTAEPTTRATTSSESPPTSH